MMRLREAGLIVALLGGLVDPGQVWEYVGDTGWHEIGNGTWRVCLTPTVLGKVEVLAMPHIRSWDGNGTYTGHYRLYNKLRLVRVSPIRHETLAMSSESLWEGTPGYGDQLRAFDNSRTVLAVDLSPMLNQINCYAVEAVAGDGIHIEVAYGSPLRIVLYPD